MFNNSVYIFQICRHAKRYSNFHLKMILMYVFIYELASYLVMPGERHLATLICLKLSVVLLFQHVQEIYVSVVTIFKILWSKSVQNFSDNYGVEKHEIPLMDLYSILNLF